MSFLIYFVVLLIAGASALFGLDLLTAPLPQKPSTHVAASTNSSSKLARRAAERRAAKNEVHADQALTPVHPTNLADKDHKDVRMVYPPTNETTGVVSTAEKEGATSTRQVQRNEPTAPQEAAAAVADKSAVANKNGAGVSVAKATESPASAASSPAPAAQQPTQQATVQPAAQQSTNRCNIQACASAYRSFRAEDCSYQPFAGPRRVCTAPPAQQRSAERTTHGSDWRQDNRGARRAARDEDPELRDVAQRVKELTRDDFDDDESAASVPRGRRLIVIETAPSPFRAPWR